MNFLYNNFLKLNKIFIQHVMLKIKRLNYLFLVYKKVQIEILNTKMVISTHLLSIFNYKMLTQVLKKSFITY